MSDDQTVASPTSPTNPTSIRSAPDLPKERFDSDREAVIPKGKSPPHAVQVFEIRLSPQRDAVAQTTDPARKKRVRAPNRVRVT